MCSFRGDFKHQPSGHNGPTASRHRDLCLDPVLDSIKSWVFFQDKLPPSYRKPQETPIYITYLFIYYLLLFIIIVYYLLLFIYFYYYYCLLFIIIYLFLLLFIYYYHLIMTIMIYYYYYYDCSWLRYRTWAQPGFHVPTRSEGYLKSGWEQTSEEARARGRREPHPSGWPRRDPHGFQCEGFMLLAYIQFSNRSKKAYVMLTLKIHTQKWNLGSVLDLFIHSMGISGS